MKQVQLKQTKAARATKIFAVVFAMTFAGNAGRVAECRTDDTVTVETTE
jgi:hypothetical protein